MGNYSIPIRATRVSPSHSMTHYAYTPRSDGGRYAMPADGFRAASSLTPEELDVLAGAERQGYLVRSGHRLQVLREWVRRCRQTRRPVIVAIRMIREGIIEVDGKEVQRVDVADLESAASNVVMRNIDQKATLWHMPQEQVRPIL